MKLFRPSACRLLRWLLLLAGIGLVAGGCGLFTPGKSSPSSFFQPSRSKAKQKRSRDKEEHRPWFGWGREEPKKLETVNDWLDLKPVRPWEPLD